MSFDPSLGAGLQLVEGVRRWHCGVCNSPVAATFDYLPGQIYVPLGVIDQADTLPPDLHCHAASSLPWLHLDDGLTRVQNTARDHLKTS